VTQGKPIALHAGNGYAIRSVTGPNLGTPFQYQQPSSG